MRSVGHDYLAAIYALHAEGEDVYAVALADRFGVSRANASATIGRLVRDGLVEVAGRQILLTPSGCADAEAGLRRHRLTERFLVDVLGIDWSSVHEQARAFERGLSPLLEERIDARLGHPRTCPHGNPVPRPDLDAAAYLRDRRALRLAAAPIGRPTTLLLISELIEDRADLLGFCARHGLRPGEALTVQEQRAGGAIGVLRGDDALAVEGALARSIWVTLDAAHS